MPSFDGYRRRKFPSGLNDEQWYQITKWMRLVAAGLASLVGYGIFNTLLARNPSAAVVPWVLLAPVVAMTAAWLLLGDLPTVGEAGGGLLLVLGVLLALRAPRGRSAPSCACTVSNSDASSMASRFRSSSSYRACTRLGSPNML